MTRGEFDSKFDIAYANALKSSNYKELIYNSLKENETSDGKISPENTILASYTIFSKLNRQLLKGVLQELLQFDE